MRTTKPSRTRLALAGLGLGLLLPLTAVSAVSASTDGDRVAEADPRPETDRRRPERKHDRRIEVLEMRCGIADGPSPDGRVDDGGVEVTDAEVETAVSTSDAASPTRVHIGCRWRAAEHPKAVGYQLWRIVDRGERELVARGGLDMLGARDVVSSEATVVRYAVLALDADGHRVGQSRVQWVRVGDDRPNGLRPTDARSARIR